jgi:hypothetical protein
MYDVDGKKSSDETVIYDRGGWVFWMLYDYLGHEPALEGYRHFIRTWSVSRDHPALQDFVAAMRPYAADSAAYDSFVKQWMEDRAMPEYRFTSARKEKRGDGWDVVVHVRNIGTGTMPVEIAAEAGERWAKRGGGPSPQAPAPGSTPAPATVPRYREARGNITLGAGQEKELTIHCAFPPERVVADPDVRVLQLRRKLAVAVL